MLILTRKVGQQIQVGDVTITITRLGNTFARIGIDAPAEIPIRRIDDSDSRLMVEPPAPPSVGKSHHR